MTETKLPLPRRRVSRIGLGLLAIGCVVVVGSYRLQQSHYWQHPHTSETLIDIVHAPPSYDRRTGDFTANVIGSASLMAQSTEYRLNSGDWHDVGQDDLRSRAPMFVVEMAEAELNDGDNQLELRATPYVGEVETKKISFQYNSAPVQLPVHADWKDARLDASNGFWERFEEDGEWRVGVKPGYEGYDWVLNVTGAFPEARRVETDVVFRSSETQGYGFGALPLWGGMPDNPGVTPRRGWNFAIAWYWTKVGGISTEFSYFHPDAENRFVRESQPLQIQAGTKYKLVAEAWPEANEHAAHSGFRQRMKWWPANAAEPAGWLECRDSERLLPAGDYAVALVALKCQVDFGPVTVTSLATASVKNELVSTEP